MNIASSLQHRFQEVYLDLVRNLRERSSRNTCVIAGGCALNSVANGLQDLNLFDKYIFHPACSDDGLAVGSALYTSRVELNETPSSRTTTFSPYLGTSYTDDEIIKVLQDNKATYQHYHDDIDLFTIVSRLLSQGNIVGWFRGRCEWGPRALGNRSILANPIYPDMKEKLNSRIKNRESFRPFAPLVRSDRMSDVFESSVLTPFMLHVVNVRDSWRKVIPAATHVDGAARVQSVSRSDNLISTAC